MASRFRFPATGNDDGSVYAVRDADDVVLGRLIPRRTLGRGYGSKSQMSTRHVLQWEATVRGLGLDDHDERLVSRRLKRWKVTRRAAAELLEQAYVAAGIEPLSAEVE
jgi:hypothetical protein